MAWDFPQPFTLPVSPSVNDIDGLNHTNNAVYVQWCEKIAWAHSAALGLDLADYQRLDLYYVDNWSVVTDLVILAKTVPAVLRRNGAA